MSFDFSSKKFVYQNIAVDPENLSTPMWRYLSIKKYVDLLSSNSLFFCRVDKFEDQYEGVPNSYTFELIDNSFKSFSNAAEMREQWKASLTSLRKITFVNCWHMADAESPEMWKQYCPKGKGVLIKSNYERIKSSLINMDVGHVFISPVTYAEAIDENVPLINGMNIVCYKRPEFKHEREFRLVLQYLNSTPSENDTEDSYTVIAPEHGFRNSVDLKMLIDEVYISSNLSLLDKLRIDLATKAILGKRLLKSQMN